VRPEENLKKLPPKIHFARVVLNASDTPSIYEYDTDDSSMSVEVVIEDAFASSSLGKTRKTRHAENKPAPPTTNRV